MQPRFLLVGIVQAKPNVRTSQLNKQYCEVKVEASWQTNYNNQVMNIVSPYNVVFYGQKVDIAAGLNMGDQVVIDCLLSSKKNPGNNGNEFINYSLTGVSFTVLSNNSSVKKPLDQSNQHYSNNNNGPSNSFGNEEIPF